MTSSSGSSWADLGRELRLHGWVLASSLALLWAIQIVNVGLGGVLLGFGIHPRESSGLFGILAAPFLHANFAHLIANSGPFLVLGAMVLLRETWHFFAVTAITMVGAGLGTWLVGASGSTHVGASGVIFGYLGYLMLGGYFERRFGVVLVSVIVSVLYGSLVFGVLPGTPGISWEGHLFGFLSGVLAARILSRRNERPSRLGKPRSS